MCQALHDGVIFLRGGIFYLPTTPPPTSMCCERRQPPTLRGSYRTLSFLQGMPYSTRFPAIAPHPCSRPGPGPEPGPGQRGQLPAKAEVDLPGREGGAWMTMPASTPRKSIVERQCLTAQVARTKHVHTFLPRTHPGTKRPGDSEGPGAKFVQSEGALEPDDPLDPTQDRSFFPSDRLGAH